MKRKKNESLLKDFLLLVVHALAAAAIIRIIFNGGLI